MKKLSLLFLFLFIFFFIPNFTYSQLLLIDNFDYPNGAALTDWGWTINDASGTLNQIHVGTNNGLSYTGYANSGIGNAAIMKETGQDVYRSFTPQITGGNPNVINVYVSFLVNMTTPRTGDYFLCLQDHNDGIVYYLRTYAQAVTGGWNIGLSKSYEGPVYGTHTLALNTTYLVVLRYTINPNSTTDDEIVAYVFTDPILPASEGLAAGVATEQIGPFTININQTDAFIDLGRILLRQGSTGSSPDLVIDGIRVGNTWNDAPLPVELSSFTSNTNGRNVQLSWETKTEKNSDKFVIERQTIGAAWEAIGSVKAAVLSNSPKNYSYTDTKLQSGKYQYRLKMIDNDGSFAYSKIVETEVAVPKDFAVSQNYPNPFNPSTKINYQVPVDAKVILEVYNIAGQKVSELVNQEQLAGYYSVDFGASKFSSGVYIYRLVAIDKASGNNFSAIKKMMLLK
jgi:hypothetical protein